MRKEPVSLGRGSCVAKMDVKLLVSNQTECPNICGNIRPFLLGIPGAKVDQGSLSQVLYLLAAYRLLRSVKS